MELEINVFVTDLQEPELFLVPLSMVVWIKFASKIHEFGQFPQMRWQVEIIALHVTTIRVRAPKILAALLVNQIVSFLSNGKNWALHVGTSPTRPTRPPVSLDNLKFLSRTRGWLP